MDILDIQKVREENRLLNEKEIKEKKIVLKSKPQNILLILNNVCNLKCIMCEEFMPHKYIISDTLFYDIVNNMKYFDSFSCQGGEPLIFDKFNIILDKTKKFHTHLNITTNGILLNESLIEKMYDMSIILHISIDGFDKKTYESIRVGASFDVLKKNLQLLNSIKNKQGYKQLRYELFMVPQKLNYTKVVDAVDFAKQYGFSGIRFLQIRVYANKNCLLNNEESSFVKKQIIACMERVKIEELNINIDTDIPLDYDDERTNCLKNYLIKDFRDICVAPWKTISIQKFQQVSIDCLCNFKKADVVKTLEDAWNSQYIQKIRKGLVANKPFSSCMNCYKNSLFKNISGKN